MSMRKILTLILITTFLNACRTQPQLFIGKQCSPVFFYEDIAGVPYISTEKSTCLCRQYKVSVEFIGPITESVIEPIATCNKIVGYSPKQYVELNSLMEYVRQNINTSPKLHPELGHR